MADEYLGEYKLRNPKSSDFADYAVRHLKRLCRAVMSVDMNERTVRDYQTARLRESASPKSINEETGFLLPILGDSGELIRVKMRRQKTLKLKAGKQVAKAFTVEQKEAMLAAAAEVRSPGIFPALTLALNCGLRDAEIRQLQWGRIDLLRRILTVGDSKTEARESRTIPLNPDARAALEAHSRWYLEKFGETRPLWSAFPIGKPIPYDPERPVTTFNTAWAKVRMAAGVTGRWHDNRHTFITDLAESGEASDETIGDIAGHVSKEMLKHYSHIRMDAKRRAVNSHGRKAEAPTDNPHLSMAEKLLSEGLPAESKNVVP